MSVLRKANFQRGCCRGIALAIALSASQLFVDRLTADDAFPEPPVKVKTYDLELSPPAKSKSTLKHKLFLGLEDRTPGNAADYYRRAIVANIQSNPSNPAQHFSNTDWLDAALDQLPLNEIQKVLDKKSVVLEELKLATVCERCDWGVRFQDLRGLEVLSVRLEEFQQSRDLARVLRLKARKAIAQKQHEEATEAIRQLYQLSNDIAYVPSVICGLVAAAIRSYANDSLMELISAPNSPGFYWELRALPDSFEGVLESARFESSMALRIFPFLKDADTSLRTSEEWNRLLTDVVISLDESPFAASKGSMQSKLQLATVVMKAYPIAKRELAAAGFDEERLEQLPISQVIAIYARECDQYVADECAKVTLLPFPESKLKAEQLFKRLAFDGYMGIGSNIASWRDPLMLSNRLTGAVPQVILAANRQRFMYASLIVIEAIRAHMAANNGQLPRSLDEIKTAPIPSDPTTGRPFLYRLIEQKAELLVLPTEPNEYAGRRFLLTPRK